jgi:hypothetical protein
VSPGFAKSVVTPEKVVKVFHGMFAVDTGGWQLGVIAIGDFGSGNDIVAEFDQLNVARGHAA